MSRDRKLITGLLVFTLLFAVFSAWKIYTGKRAAGISNNDVSPSPPTIHNAPSPAFDNNPIPLVLPGYSGSVKSERESPLAVTSDQIFMDYQQNEVMADQKYKGKALDVSGIVYKIRRLEEGKPMLVLSNYFDYGEVAAVIALGQDGQVAKLRMGSSVQLSCTGAGLIMGNPVVGECQLAESASEKVSPSP